MQNKIVSALFCYLDVFIKIENIFLLLKSGQ